MARRVVWVIIIAVDGGDGATAAHCTRPASHGSSGVSICPRARSGKFIPVLPVVELYLQYGTHRGSESCVHAP